jgi:transcriptional regulator with XRE-family HTH domain
MPRERGSVIPQDVRDEYVEIAWSMSVRGKSQREIAQHLDVSTNTVARLIQENAKWIQHTRTYEAPMAIARYTLVIQKALDAFDELKDKPTATNRAAYLSRVIEAQKAIDDITGAKAPVEWKGRIEHLDLSKFNGEELEALERLFERAAID